MSAADTESWLQLIRAFAGRSTAGAAFLKHFADDPARLLRASPADLAAAKIPEGVRKAIAEPAVDLLAADVDWLRQPDCHLLPITDSAYPPQLKEISDPPLALFCRGNPQLLWLPQLAIVGTRQPTAGGRRHAAAFAAAIAGQGLVITSGLALGVDGQAHAAALKASGVTVAVAATGLDRIYPARHRELGQAIARSGVLVSEFPPGWEPRRRSFPQRNRIISGLSLAVLVIEASVQSGSLITARLAGEQGRDVFAVPGSIDNPLARGCHRLIKQGARLVEDTDDLIGELAPRAQRFAAERRLELTRPQPPGEAGAPPAGQAESVVDRSDPDYQRLLDALGFDEQSVDELVSASGLTAAAVSSMLLILELDGLVQMSPAGGYSRTG
ncbi:MAG: DNA-processing protein DprA [Pseudomonadota bacterium]